MKIMTKEEIAKILRVHQRTVERWLGRGILGGYKLGEGRTALWRISEDDFKKFLKKYKN
jgi:excisionase family DNA binding protein